MLIGSRTIEILIWRMQSRSASNPINKYIEGRLEQSGHSWSSRRFSVRSGFVLSAYLAPRRGGAGKQPLNVWEKRKLHKFPARLKIGIWERKRNMRTLREWTLCVTKVTIYPIEYHLENVCELFFEVFHVK